MASKGDGWPLFRGLRRKTHDLRSYRRPQVPQRAARSSPPL